MGSTTEQYVLAPATAEDVPQMVTVYNNAFRNNTLDPLLFPPTVSSEDRNSWLNVRFLKQLSIPEIHVFKITDTVSGHIAAFIRWGYPHVLSEEEKAKREVEKEEEKKKGSPFPKGANVSLATEKFGGLDAAREKYVKWDDTYVVYLLACDPAHQRRGLASRLLRHGLDIADEEGRVVYIEASTAGHPVYLKLGFEDIDHLTFDLTKWGGPGIEKDAIMKRQPLKKD